MLSLRASLSNPVYLSHLHLRHFRNFGDLKLALNPRINIFVGDNAKGKTNIIEAVYFLSENHSFRSGITTDLIQWGVDTATIETECVRDDLKDHVAVEITATGKQFYRNRKKCRGLPELTTVLFAPEALQLTKAGPGVRREFLDHLLGQLYPAYRPLLRKYHQALIQHNRLLQNDELSWQAIVQQMDGWKTQLIDYGAELSVMRAQGIAEINQLLPAAYAAIAGSGDVAQLRYQPRNGADILSLSPLRGEGRLSAKALASAEGEGGLKSTMIQCLAAAFRDRADDEQRRRVTLVGPHRDDFSAHIGDKEVRHFASQGEHRSLVLALKRCEIILLQDVHGHSPILLLDDVASELDPERNKSFFSHLLEMPGQVFISAVSKDDVVLPKTEDSCWFAVRDGAVERTDSTIIR